MAVLRKLEHRYDAGYIELVLGVVHLRNLQSVVPDQVLLFEFSCFQDSWDISMSRCQSIQAENFDGSEVETARIDHGGIEVDFFFLHFLINSFSTRVLLL